jgi:CRP-like cAMP-binding protein
MSIRPQYADAIRPLALFAALDDEQFETLCRRMHAVPFEDGQILFQRGEPAKHFFVVLEGSVKLALQSRTGEEKVVERLGAGQSFAEALTFMDAPAYPLAAIGTEPGLAIAVPGPEYRTYLAESPATCLRLLAEMSRRMHGLVREIEELTLASATARLVRHVLELAAQQPGSSAPDGSLVVTLAEAKQSLAARLTIRPETLSRILRALAEDGIVTVEGRSIRVHDLARFRAAA